MRNGGDRAAGDLPEVWTPDSPRRHKDHRTFNRTANGLCWFDNRIGQAVVAEKGDSKIPRQGSVVGLRLE